jgi:WD40 repeat protein
MSKTATSSEELNFGKYHVDAIAVSHDDRVVIAASSLTTNVWDGVLQVVRWPGADSASGVEVQASFATATGNAAVAWLTDDSLAAGGDDGTVSIWTLPPAGHTALGGVQVPPVKLSAHAGAVTCVGLSGGVDGTRLASASLDGTARLWDASAGKPGAVTLRLRQPQPQPEPKPWPERQPTAKLEPQPEVEARSQAGKSEAVRSLEHVSDQSW